MRYEITITGVVQGVGFRPFVAALAEELHISGSVCNSGGVVKIDTFGNEEAMDKFICRLRSSAPPAAQVKEVRAKKLAQNSPKDENCPADFYIMPSEGKNETDIPLLPPDLPVCEDCLAEMHNPSDARFHYPFISCVNCGPRYSIIEEIPYDREHITMREFPMCPACQREYTRQADRRRHAQTISCRNCGPQLLWTDNGSTVLSRDEALEAAIRQLKNGGVLALKGVGGYQLSCQPASEDAVRRLRILKHRKKKPFAVMFPSLDSIREYCILSSEEEKLLCSAARPIVLLSWKEGGKAFSDSVGGESRYLGGFLPCTGLHQMLTEEAGPLIMTSCNVTEEPILTTEEEIQQLWEQQPSCLDGIAWNTRKIVTPLDDSLMRVTGGRPQMLRRSRGFVPSPILLPGECAGTVLAMGGDLKSAFCLASGNRAYMSQYFGDMENYKVFQTYMAAKERMERLFGLHPKTVACDMHPGYLTFAQAEKIASLHNLELLLFQHHHAHAASVMAEHGLNSCIAVIFDGTGYGTDGSIWGGEFLICTDSSFVRAGHLDETELCGGDASAKDAVLTAACHLLHAGPALRDEALAKLLPDCNSAIVGAAVASHINTEKSTSMGRLFDAVSALLGIREYNTYEGECAIALENAAAGAMEKGLAPARLPFPIRETPEGLTADRRELIRTLCRELVSFGRDKNRGKDGEKNAPGPEIQALALGFHEAAAGMVLEMCRLLRERFHENKVALGGGVFANVILQERCQQLLKKDGFTVYVNEQVPGNDGGIALGQAWLASLTMKQ